MARLVKEKTQVLLLLTHLLYSTSTVRSLARRAAMPGRAMAAKAGPLSTRSVRLVLARSVTTTRAPAAAQSFLSLHRTCSPERTHARRNRITHLLAFFVATRAFFPAMDVEEEKVSYLEAGAAADAGPVQRGARGGEEAGAQGRRLGAVPA